MSFPFLDLKPLHSSLRGEIDAAIARVIDSSNFICGPELESFETEWASYCGCEHAVGVSNGLDALILILKALGIGPGDEVIIPANTFIATALAVDAAGATPVLVDVDPSTFNMSAELVEKKITGKTRAIMPVHLYGRLAPMKELAELAGRHGILVIEDAAQAHGAESGGVRAGGFGIAAGFSFYPGKNLGALGDGGAVVTNDGALAEKVRLLRNYGSVKKYEHRERGVNARLDEMQAAILRVKLRHLDAGNILRRQMANLYLEELQGTDLVLPEMPTPASEHVWHLFVVRSKEAARIRASLAEAGVQTLVHYPTPVHLQAAYRHLGHSEGDFPVTEALSREIISLPFWLGLDVPSCARAVRGVTQSIDTREFERESSISL